jgi:hypothetical protein
LTDFKNGYIGIGDIEADDERCNAFMRTIKGKKYPESFSFYIEHTRFVTHRQNSFSEEF